MKATEHIAIDLGAESGRVISGRIVEGKLSVAEVHRFPNEPIRLLGTLRWNLMALWKGVLAGLRQIGDAGLSARSVSVDSWGVDYVLVRGQEPMHGLPFHYRDPRADGPFRTLREKIGDETIYEETGIQFMTLNSIYQLAADVERDRGWVESADGFLMIADWFHWMLSGVRGVEETNASTTQLYDPRRRTWARALIKRCELPQRLFPEALVIPGTRIGPLAAEVAHETNLAGVEVVACCTHDTASAVVAVPAEGDICAYLSSGTWSLLGVELEQPIISEASRRANFTNEVGFGGTIRLLKNIAGLWILQECRRAWATGGLEISYEELMELAQASEPLRSLIRPDDQRFVRAGEMPEKVRALCRETKQPVPETPGQFARCIFDSLALSYASVLSEIEGLIGREIATLHIVGGGSRNRLLNQLAADATGRRVVAGPVEATAIGNLLVQAIAFGELASLQEARRLVSRSFELTTFEPQPGEAWSTAAKYFASLAGAEVTG
ncbi:MAG: rhamnulokinase family protein [Chthoniobacteraceae bacterium]